MGTSAPLTVSLPAAIHAARGALANGAPQQSVPQS